jgi:hypothetical protein
MSASAPTGRQVTLVGNLTADPVLNRLDDARNVCRLRLAVNDQKTSRCLSTSPPSASKPTLEPNTSATAARSR